MDGNVLTFWLESEGCGCVVLLVTSDITMSSVSDPSSASENIPLVILRRSRANSDVGAYRPRQLKPRRFISSSLLHTHTLPEVGQH